MNRRLSRLSLFAAAALAAVGIVRAADDKQVLAPAPPRPAAESNAFFHSFLAPRMSARLGGARAAVMSEFASPTANPWTRSTEATEDLVQRGAIRATKSAVKRYALERLNLTGWSIPLSKSGPARGLESFRTESGGPRLRVGFSHRAPNAEVMLPLDHGRVAFSADARGRVGASYETTTGWLRVGAYVDPKDDSASAAMSISF
jgi:hypothetical protein